MIDYREKIAEVFYEALGRCGGLDWDYLWEGADLKYKCRKYADQILSTVISEGKVCDSCKGSSNTVHTLYGGSQTKETHCLKCVKGKLPDVTIGDAIKEKLGG